MQIEKATAKDCRAIAEVHVASWRRAYEGILPQSYLDSLSVSDREAMWRRMIERQAGQVVLARDTGQVVGFVAFGAARDDGTPARGAEMWALYVAPACWSRGAGRLLWLDAMQRIRAEGYRSISLWVAAGNERAIGFYERAGCVPDRASCRSVEIAGTAFDQLRYVRHAE